MTHPPRVLSLLMTPVVMIPILVLLPLFLARLCRGQETPFSHQLRRSAGQEEAHEVEGEVLNNAFDGKKFGKILSKEPRRRDLPASSATWWQPKASDGLLWQWQLQGTIDTVTYSFVDMYDIDLFDTPQSVIDALHQQGKIVICYFSAGSYEYWRPDWPVFFPFVKNNTAYKGRKPPFAGKMAGWNERWLDIRRIDLLAPIMTYRLQLAVDKKCDGVEPDNMDAYTNRLQTRLPRLNAEDQLTYNRWIAQQAHALGLSVGLKNDLDQIPDLVNDFDWALNEQCFQYNECDAYVNFTALDKAVFGVEYEGTLCDFCGQSQRKSLSWMKKKLDLDAWRQGCEQCS